MRECSKQALVLLLPLALFAIFGSALAAQQTTRTKSTYFATDSSLPDLAADYLRGHPGNALEITTINRPGRDPVQIYYAFGPASRSPQGVCRFTATQIFPHTDDSNVTWDSKPPNPRDNVDPPFSMAAVGTPLCPPQREDVYTALENGISDAEFVTITEYWREISGSEEAFDQATVLLPLLVSPRTGQRFTAFRSAVFRSGGPVAHLRAVFRAGVEAYQLAFAEASADPAMYFMSVSKSENGFQVLNFQTRF